MIDRIKLKYSDRIGYYDVWEETKKTLKPIPYNGHIIRHEASNFQKNHSMRFDYNSWDSKFYIDGSIRKWALGANNLNDLSRAAFVASIKRLALRIRLPYEEILKCNFFYLEIGFNFRLKDACSDYLQRFIRCSSFEKNSRRESIDFSGSEKRIIAYNKLTERSEKGSKKLFKKIAIHYPHDVLRIEVQLKGARIISKELGIGTVADLIEKYHTLAEYLKKQIFNIKVSQEEIASVKCFRKKKLKELKQYAFYLGIKAIGDEKYLQFIKEVEGAPPNKTTHIQEVVELLENPPFVENTDAASFRSEVINNLTTFLEKSESLREKHITLPGIS